MLHPARAISNRTRWLLAAVWLAAAGAQAQAPASPSVDVLGSSGIKSPLAIVALSAPNPKSAPSVAGSMKVYNGRAFLTGSGTITSGDTTVQATLPYRGTLRVCAATTVKLASDTSVPEGETPGLMMAIDRGALEMSFATARNSDVLMTPDFRIVIAGPGSAEVKVRLGEHGDTCIDNAGANAPYVLVSSVFEGGAFRVQPGQRVMFQHGSLKEVVDNEKEPCGCPPAPKKESNEFPLAQSEGLALAPAVPPLAASTGSHSTAAPPLVYTSPAPVLPPAAEAAQPKQENTPVAAKPVPGKKKRGFFGGIGHFFRKVFGADES